MSLLRGALRPQTSASIRFAPIPLQTLRAGLTNATPQFRKLTTSEALILNPN
jgi:hypothetical protein